MTVIRSESGKVTNVTSENSDKSTPTENLEAIIAERVAEKEKAFEAERQRYQKGNPSWPGRPGSLFAEFDEQYRKPSACLPGCL
jgi:hypothetical protein